MVRKENIVEVEGLRGGKGSAEIHHILDKEELMDMEKCMHVLFFVLIAALAGINM